MKKSILVSLLVFGYTLIGANAAYALGICIETAASCNDYYFTLSDETDDTYSMHGYEYGCGLQNRQATGVVRQDLSTWYIGFTGTNHEFDFTQQVTWSGNVNAATLTGTQSVMYTYMSGGALTSHGASGAITVALCIDPAIANLSEVSGTDTSKQ